jgi:small-conductance mechanosensitive channel
MDLKEVESFATHLFHYKLFEINRTPVTLSSIVMFIVVITIFYIFSRLFQNLLRNKILAHFRIDKGTQFTLSRISHYLVMT